MLLPFVKCVVVQGEKRLCPSWCFKTQRGKRGKTRVMNSGNLQTATLYKFS